MTLTLFADAGGPFLLVIFGGMAVAGLALFAGLVLGGLWLAKRMRPRAPAPGSLDFPEGNETPPHSP